MMGLFSKRFDIQKDRLNVFFDINTKAYVATKGSDIIANEYLNRRSQKLLEEKNNQLVNNPELVEREMTKFRDLQRFIKLKEMGYNPNGFENLGEIHGTMTKQMADYLKGLTSEPDVVIGIHRVGSLPNEKILDILNRGLKMTGHNGSGAPGHDVLENNVSFYSNNEKIIKELMYADAYKNSRGSILVRIPDQDLEGNIYVDVPELDEQGNTLYSKRLDPKYIIGYVPVEPNHHISHIVTKNNPNFVNQNTSEYEEIVPYEYTPVFERGNNQSRGR